ncbi:MAG TPA: hypothetical protein HPP80_06390 [Rhodospirillaceae bacterium]|nr:hypothetical protein [Rhodospirillaceae bacterium]
MNILNYKILYSEPNRLLFNSRLRFQLYRKVGGLIRTGMPLPLALDAVWQYASNTGRRNSVLAAVLKDWRQRVYDGQGCGRSLAHWVPFSEWIIIEAGAANLAEALDDAARLIDVSRQVAAAVMNALTYPLFLLVLFMGILWVFSEQALPAFAQIKPMAEWTGISAGMAVLAELAHWSLLPMAIGAILGLALFWWTLPKWTGRLRGLLDHYIPWSLYRFLRAVSFLMSLSALLRSGLPIIEAIRRLRVSAGPWLAERLDAVLYYLSSGHDLGTALRLAGHGFPDDQLIEDLAIHASIGGLEESLDGIVKEWLALKIEHLNRSAGIIRALSMVFLAFSIAIMQLSIIGLQQQLTSGL